MNPLTSTPAKIGRFRQALLNASVPPRSNGNAFLVYNDKMWETAPYLFVTSAKQPDVRYEEPFATLAKEAIGSGKTLLSFDRLYTIYNAILSVCRARQYRSFNAIEIGVFRGGNSLFMAQLISHLGIRTPRLDCFDTFSGHASQDLSAAKDRLDVHNEKVFKNTCLASVQALLSGYSFARCIAGRFEDTCTILEDVNLDFVHLDVDLFEPTSHALKFLYPRLNPGGAIIVDDYRFTTCPGAKTAVDEFAEQTPSCFGLPMLTGQYIVLKVANS